MSDIKIKIDINIPFDKWTDDIEAALAEGMRDLMMKAHGEWQDAAARTLHSTKRAYQEAIQYKIVDPRTVHLSLSHNDKRKNWLVNALELGQESFPGRVPKTLESSKATTWSSGPKRGSAKATPFMDIPKWGKGAVPIEGAVPAGGYRRMTANNASKWKHPGFRPSGKGGLQKPLREDVVQMIKDKAPGLFKKLIDEVVKA